PSTSAWCLVSARPPSPRFTPIPYTTLFRSPGAPVGAGHDGARLAHPLNRPLIEGGLQAPLLLMHERVLDLHQRRLGVSEAAFGEDRKSTRLNSSHVKISYAVCCLKKKRDDK